MAGKVDIDEATVAYLAAEGMTQVEIGRSLGLSQSAVSRLLNKGENPHLEKRPPYRFKAETISAEQMDAILRRASRKHLPKYLHDLATAHGHLRGPVIRVLPANPPNIDKIPPARVKAERFMEFTRQAAPYIASLLTRDSVRICGVAWGYMLHDLCVALRQMNRPPRWNRDIVHVTPLSGDPLQDREDEPPSLTSSNIAAELGRIVNGPDYRTPWLGLVPAFVPEEFGDADMAVIDRMIHMVPDYERIFGPTGRDGEQTGMASRMDMLITSMGTAENPLGFGNGRLLGSLGPKLEQLKTEIRGDVGGVLLTRVPGEPSPLVRMIESRWKGVRRWHIASCVRRAALEDPLTGRPGSVVLSMGADRAVAIAAAVAEGLVSHLVIDQTLESALESLLARDR